MRMTSPAFAARPVDDGAPPHHNATFASYVGTQPLGLWLTERVLGSMPKAGGWRFGPLHEHTETAEHHASETPVRLIYPGV